MSENPGALILSDGHTTVRRALEVANDMHDLAEERADDCDDTAAGLLSEGAALIEMLAAKLAEVRNGNGALIAAAPDMLAALKRALNWLASYPGGCAEGAYMDAVNALKKAGRYDD